MLLYTNQRGQLLAFGKLWTSLDSDNATTTYIEGEEAEYMRGICVTPLDTRYSANDKLRALLYNFTEFGANSMVFIKV